MIVRYLPNGCRKISRLLIPMQQQRQHLSAEASSTSPTLHDVPRAAADEMSRGIEPFLADVLSSSNLLAKLEPVSTIPEPVGMLEYIPYLPQMLLDTVQQSTGIPWWGVLMGGAALLRFSALPVRVSLEKAVLARLPLIRLERDAILAKRSGDLVESVKKQEEAADWMRKHKAGSSIWLARYSVPAALIFFLNYTAINGLAVLPYGPLVETSFLWLPSLAIKDPNTILSFLNTILLTVLAKQALRSVPDPEQVKWLSDSYGYTTLFLFAGLGIQAHLPSAVLLAWLASNSTALLINGSLLKVDVFRRTLGLPSVEERTRLFAEVPKTTPPPSAVQIANQPAQISLLDVGHTVQESELEELWEEENFAELEDRVQEMLEKEDKQQKKLEEDLMFCKEKVAELEKYRILSVDKRSKLLSLRTQVELINSEMKESAQRVSRLHVMLRKREIALRNKRLDDLTETGDKVESESESESDLVSELDTQGTILPTMYTELLEQLEQCEGELATIADSNMQPYEKFIKKRELVDLQSKLLKDIQFCEEQTITLEKRNRDKELPAPKEPAE